MNKYKFSIKTNSFYPIDFLSEYNEAGTLPNDLMDVDESVFLVFSGIPPIGKIRGGKEDGPCWIDALPHKQE